jgi:electron transfer flavoprotein beta subunit
MEILVCVKRVPMVGGQIAVTEDGQQVDTRLSGFTVSPHEECAVEEAVRIVARRGGAVTVLTLGPPAAAEQLRAALAVGASHAILLATDGREWGPIATAEAITAAVRSRARAAAASGADAVGGAGTGPYELLLFGNEAADTGGYQVGVRVAHALRLPCVTAIKSIELIGEGRIRARREYQGRGEVFEIALPAVISVKEGINLPRYPSFPGRVRAKKAVIEEIRPPWRGEALRMQRLRVPAGERRRAQILGTGVAAVPALVALLDELGVLP